MVLGLDVLRWSEVESLASKPGISAIRPGEFLLSASPFFLSPLAPASRGGKGPEMREVVRLAVGVEVAALAR
jgi:hypothetical protein